MARGKGRVSNELVAASCAAVLTVYAAGYWRTREVARRLEAQAQDRRPAQPVALPESPAATVAATPTLPAQIATPPPSPPPAAKVSKPAKKAPAKKAAEPPPVVAAVPAIMSVPLEETPQLGPTPPPGAEVVPTSTAGWHDGTYTGWGQSNHGDIEAKVVIENGRIVGSGIATCATRYPCDVIDSILHQPVWRQSPEVDRVSRATESADAYYYGLVEALKKAAEGPADTATSSR